MKNRFWFTFTLLISFSLISCSQNDQDINKIAIGFYNLENLFDTIDSPNVIDEEFTPGSKKGWNTKRYNDKLDKLSQVISEIGFDETGLGCAVLGLSEVENKGVVEDLVAHENIRSRNYNIVHYDSPDKRGIDVALIYQPDIFEKESSKSYTLTIDGENDFYTRDQLLVSGNLKGERTHFIVVHWPSRRGGAEESAYKRMAAANLSRSIVDSIIEADGKSANVIVLGDLNDDPSDESVKLGLKSSSVKKDVKNGMLYNGFSKMHTDENGTLCWRGIWNLFDQILVTKNLLNWSKSSNLKFDKAFIFDKPYLRQSGGKYDKYPNRTYAGSKYLGGYSDHLPTFITLAMKGNRE
jgi:hypothetical protein